MSNVEYLIHTILRNSFYDICKRHNIYKQIYKAASKVFTRHYMAEIWPFFLITFEHICTNCHSFYNRSDIKPA